MRFCYLADTLKSKNESFNACVMSQCPQCVPVLLQEFDRNSLLIKDANRTAISKVENDTVGLNSTDSTTPDFVWMQG